MSFERLPEELLSRICKNSVAACTFPDAATSLRIAGLALGIQCENRGIEALSRVSSKLRRICLPGLFSRLIIYFVETHSGVEVDNLERFIRVLHHRPHIARYVLEISYSFSGSSGRGSDSSSPEVELLPQLLALVPSLTELSDLSALVTEDLIRGFNQHPSLQSVNISSSSSLDPTLLENPQPGLLRKIICGSYDLLKPDLHRLEQLREMGLRIQCVAVSPFGVDLQRLGAIYSGTLARIHFLLMPWQGRPDYPRWPSFLGCLSSFLHELGDRNSLTSIRISSVSTRSMFLNDMHRYLPLLSDLLPSSGGAPQTTTLDDSFLISGYTLEKSDAASTSSVDLGDASYWSRHWDVVELIVNCTRWPITSSHLQALSARAPLVRDLDLYRSDRDETADRSRVMQIPNIIDIAPGLNAFKHLQRLELGTMVLPDLDSEDDDEGSQESREDATSEDQAPHMPGLVGRYEEEEDVEGGHEYEGAGEGEEDGESEEDVDDLTLIAGMCHVLREQVPSLETVVVRIPCDFKPTLDVIEAYIVRKHEGGQDEVTVLRVRK